MRLLGYVRKIKDLVDDMHEKNKQNKNDQKVLSIQEETFRETLE